MTEKESEALILLATETIKACRAIIGGLSINTVEPKLVGLVQASKLVDRSRVWLRRKLEKGELTGYQTGRGGNWQVDPGILLKELTTITNTPKVPIRRRRI